ncbi:dGTP triphosphohydrolase [Deinococcus sp. VB343]|uniref:Deoxyguanosinetriphosphate triphosphohydrolase-like protein n=1 Tax=Deinococcus sp. VB142 TaxID=3112952 RepID=A0AAU6Q4B0_9DEIO
MFSRADLESREAAFLAPYARLSRDARREHAEEESQTRTAFQKDRDRVLHTKAFRRLEAKTQVFLNAPALGDHYRTRLTHTLEVQQVARSLALTLGLNETLTETVALAHDLGHPPFGHAGERLLGALMQEDGGFDHNAQARRIVTLLEERSGGKPGLNLTLDTLDGLNKHDRAHLPPDARQPSLEAQMVDAADALAYTAHDLDDGLRSGLLDPEALLELPLWRELLARAGVTAHPAPEQWRPLQSELLGWLITDLGESTAAAIAASGVQTPGDVAAQPQRLVTYSPELRGKLRETAEFLREHLYRHWQVERQVYQAEQVLTDLFTAFEQRPGLLPPRPRARIERDGLRRAICDHIAGMTDRYALETHAALRG